MDHDYTIIETAGLSQTEFATLIGASRLAVNNWINDRTQPHKIYQRRVEQTLEMLQHAIDTDVLPGEIPPATGGTMSDRRRFIKTAIRGLKIEQRNNRKTETA